MSKIEKLKEKMKKLQKEKVNLDQNMRGNRRKAKKALETNDPKNYAKYRHMGEFYTEQLKLIDEKIERYNNDITVEESRFKEEAYKKDFISFKRALAEDFTTFLNLLDKEEYQKAFEQLEEVEAQYNEGSKQFLPLDLKPFTSYFSFISLKRHMATILARVGKAHSLKTTAGPAVARGYEGGTKQKVKIVYGIVESIIQILMPSVKRKKKKVKEAKKKEEKVQSPSGTATTKTVVTVAESRHKTRAREAEQRQDF